MNLLTNQEIAIIGAGPAGLMTAVLLQQRGAHVTVYERDAGPEARIWGGTLDIHRNSGQHALEAAGLLPQFYALARPTAERTAAPDGTILKDELVEEATAYWRPEIDRPDLRRLLLSALRPYTVRWGRQLVGLDELADGRFQLHFMEQPAQTADVVIGANGGRSQLRRHAGGAEPVYSGTVYVQGDLHAPATNAPALAALVNGGNLLVQGGRNVFVSHTKGDGTLEVGVSFRVPEGWMAAHGISGERPTSVQALLRTTLADWAPLFQEGFEATHEWRVLPLYVVTPTADRTVLHPLTLVGDAAHLMPPFAGVGVNLGLLGALRLADCLTRESYPTLNAAIAAYERRMLPLLSMAQHMTNQAELRVHGEPTQGDVGSLFAAWHQLLQHEQSA